MKRLTIALLTMTLMIPTLAQSDPAPFGLELNKSTRQQVLETYPGTKTGTNKYSGGPMYDLETGKVAFEGLQKLTVIFDTDDTLVAALATFHKDYFNKLNGIMKNKYSLVNSQIPFVGDKSATYRDGKTEISLDAPHMGFKMSMNYVSDNLMKTFREQSRKEHEQKRSQETGAL